MMPFKHLTGETVLCLVCIFFIFHFAKMFPSVYVCVCYNKEQSCNFGNISPKDNKALK